MERQREEDGADEEDARAKRAQIEARLEEAKSTLFDHVRRGDLEKLQTLVNSMSEVDGDRAELINSTSDCGWTILHLAADLPVISWILSDSGGRAAGFNMVLATTDDGRTALHIDARCGNFERFLAIVEGCKVENGERAAMVNAVTNEGYTVLHAAACTGSLPIISWILSDSGGRSAGFNSILTKAKDGEPALHIVAEGGNLETFVAFVEGCKVENGERAAILNNADQNGCTVLHRATIFGREELVEWLLSEKGREAGFNPDNIFAFTNKKEPILHYAIVFRLSIDYLDLFLSQCRNAEERCKLLFGIDSEGYTVLHRAAVRGEAPVIEWVLSRQQRERGGSNEDLFALSNKKESVLHVAASSNLPIECFDLIFNQCKNADDRCRLLFAIDSRGRTLLHYVSDSNRLSVIEWALSHQQEARGGSNADLFALTNDKRSVLHFAAAEGSLEIFDFLVSRCNNTSERLRLFAGRDNKGWTIFHYAARWGRSELISHILRKYPEESKMIINVRDNRGMTAIHRVLIGGLDEESRAQWGNWQFEEDKLRSIVLLLGFDDREYAAATRRGSVGKRVASININGEDREKKPVDISRVIAAAGADPNLGLKFE